MGSLRPSLRLIDANFNRAKEGLRVCEDIIRFMYDDQALTQAFKKLRHDCATVLFQFPVPYKSLIDARNSRGDVGKESVILMNRKPGWKDILISNLKRSEEALRVLEEAAKVVAPKNSRGFQKLRFQLYELEKKTFKRL